VEEFNTLLLGKNEANFFLRVFPDGCGFPKYSGINFSGKVFATTIVGICPFYYPILVRR
jgi:hypothetical protein